MENIYWWHHLSSLLKVQWCDLLGSQAMLETTGSVALEDTGQDVCPTPAANLL
jgi:hypothetical protein